MFYKCVSLRLHIHHFTANSGQIAQFVTRLNLSATWCTSSLYAVVRMKPCLWTSAERVYYGLEQFVSVSNFKGSGVQFLVSSMCGSVHQSFHSILPLTIHGRSGDNQIVGSSAPVASRWLWPGNRTFLEVSSMVVTWWIVTFLSSDNRCLVHGSKLGSIEADWVGTMTPTSPGQEHVGHGYLNSRLL